MRMEPSKENVNKKKENNPITKRSKSTREEKQNQNKEGEDVKIGIESPKVNIVI